MGSSSTQAVPVPAPEVEKSEAVQTNPQPERRETPFVIKLVASIPG